MNSALPTIAGPVEVGAVLSATSRAWTGSPPITYRYGWRRCNLGGVGCVDVADAHAATYAIGSVDVGSTLRATVTASNAYGSAVAVSTQTMPVVAGPPLYAATSPFNSPIPTDAAVDPNSAAYVAGLKEVGGFTVALRGWTVPVYEAGNDTPRVDVALTESWAAADWLLNVPIPPIPICGTSRSTGSGCSSWDL